MSDHRSQQLRHPIVLRQLEVVRSQQLTPHMQRIVLGGAALTGFLSASPDDHVKVFFPNDDGQLAMPTLGPDGLQPPTDASPSPMRDYTPRHYDAQRNELTIDFVLHGDGPAASWAAQAQPGQPLGIGGPRGSLVVANDFANYVMVGDETALPAIGRWLHELPAGAHAEVLIEIAEAADRQTLSSAAYFNVQWFDRQGGSAAHSLRLEQALRNLVLPPGDTFYWIATESRRARAMRQYLSGERQVPKEWLKATGYWKAEGDDQQD